MAEPSLTQFGMVVGRGFTRRGLTAAHTEWQLVAGTHNLLKLYQASTALG